MQEAEKITEIARHYFGTYPKELLLIPSFENTLVYEIRFSNAEYILKTTKQGVDKSTRIAVEAHFCTLVRERGVPSPEIFVLDVSETLFHRVYFIMQKARGLPFRKAGLYADFNQAFLVEVGHTLRLMHSVQLPGYGHVDLEYYQNSAQICGYSPTWHEYMRDKVRSNLEYLQLSGLLGVAETTDLARLLLDYNQVLFESVDNRLLHGDFTLEHIWVDIANCKVTGIIDFGDAMIGDPVWDFVSHDWESKKILQWLLDGYLPKPILQEVFWTRLEFYRVVYTMGTLVWSHSRCIACLPNFIESLRKCVREIEQSWK